MGFATFYALLLLLLLITRTISVEDRISSYQTHATICLTELKV
jgi:hypothetical protein